eukprot:11512021-Prorocentrum_lima.AAC.1
MLFVHWEEHAPMNTHGFQPTDATFVETINMLPMIAPDQSLIPQNPHLKFASEQVEAQYWKG